MFNRSTKLTALLVAAASIASSVPAMAATKLAVKDGTIDGAIAFKDGKYLYEGYRTDDDDNGLYYNAGDKDKKLDDVDTLGFNTQDLGTIVKYGKNYVAVGEGTSDEYIVDLSTGKVSDDDTVSDLKDNAETKLQSKLKKTDRYNMGSSTTDAKITELVSKNKFDDVWYEYKATTEGQNGVRGNFETQGYVNASGSTYIDCSYNANIYVFKNGKTYKLENVGDKADNDTIVLNSIEHQFTIGQDEKYIYRLIKANISGAEGLKGGDSEVENEYYFVQKVSKAQGDKEGDAYLPKTTETYAVDDKNFWNNGDAKTAYDEIMAIKNNGAIASIVDGAIYITDWNNHGTSSEEKVKTVKLVFKSSEKIEYNDNKDKIGIRLVKKDGDKDEDAMDWSVDNNGTVWTIKDGKIKKSVKAGDFEVVYTCDRSLDRIDVYDENNLIAWDYNGDVYTTVQEGSDEAKKEATEIVGEQPAPVAKTGWQQDAATGTWTLYDAVGTQLTGWQYVGGAWYYMDPANGIMVTGWKQVNGTWYYMNQSGAMTTGWQNVGGTWYYMNQSGAMTTGWQFDGANWYYMDASGAMLSNTTVDGYVLGASGAWIK